MAVSPLTLQMTVPMTNDMAQIQNQENTRANTEHMQFANANEKQAQVKHETVIQKDSADFAEYRYDAKEKGNNEYSGNGGKKRKAPKEKKEDEEDEDAKVKHGKKMKKKHVVEIDIKL